MKIIQKIILPFAVIGAINWGLVGAFKFNLVEYLFSFNKTLISIIYSFVGLCGLISTMLVFLNFKDEERK